MPSIQQVYPETEVINVEENSGQIAIGNYNVQIGSIHGGVVNIALPEQKPRVHPRSTPILLRPRPFPGLLDRKAETGTATHALGLSEPLEFYGQPGLGKTSLLRHLAHQLPTGPAPDGIVYLSARRKATEDLLQSLFNAFYQSDIPFKPSDSELRHALQNKQALIILDDVSLNWDEVEAVMDIIPNCVIFFAASQRCLWGEGRALALRGLPPDDALALLERELGQLTAEEHPIALALCTMLDGHPLHLLQVAAVVREDGRSLAEIVNQLPQDSLEEALTAQVVASLPEPERRVMGLLAVMDGVPLPTEHLTAISGLSQPTPVLKSLLGRKLIQAHSPRYSLTGNLNRNLAQSWDITPSTEQALTYFTRWTQNKQNPEALSNAADVILNLQAWATETGRWQESVNLAQAIDNVLSLEGRWGAWSQMLQNSLKAAKSMGDQAAEAWSLHQLGTRALCLDDVTAARNSLNQALRLREALGDQVGAAITRHNLNLVLPPSPPPTDGQPPGDSPPASPSLLELSTSALLIVGVITIAALLIGAGAMWLLPKFLLATPTPAIASNIIFGTITPTPAATPSIPPADTPSLPTTDSSTAVSPTPFPQPDMPSATFTPTPSPTATDTYTPTPSPTPTATNTFSPTPSATATATDTATPTPSSTPTRQRPEISEVSPNSGEIKQEVVILVRGRNFDAENGNFKAELAGADARVFLPLGNLRTNTAFEAFVPATLPAGQYHLLVTNPDNQTATKLLAYEVIDRTPTVRPEPVVLLKPDNLNFAAQQIKTRSEALIVRLTNIGSADLEFDDITHTGANPGDFIFSDNCPTRLAPNDSCETSTYFIPAEEGNRTATLTIFSNAGNSPHDIPMSGVGIRSVADLVVTNLSMAGQPVVNRLGQVELPIQAVVMNRGNTAAEVFKVAAEYSGGNISPNSTFVVQFTAEDTGNVDPSGGYYPTTRFPLPAQSEVVFVGTLTFNGEEQGANIALQVIADSCSGDEFMPEYCRVPEENETNNASKPISVLLPKQSLNFDDRIN